MLVWVLMIRRFQFNPLLKRHASVMEYEVLEAIDGQDVEVFSRPGTDGFQPVTIGQLHTGGTPGLYIKLWVHNSELVPNDDEHTYTPEQG